jgi:hypothetical protein
MTCVLRPFGQPTEYGVNVRHYIEHIGISYLNVANLMPKKVKKRKRRNKTLALEDCKNPFHYLLLKNNMQSIQGTCNCSSRTSHLKKKTNQLEEKIYPNNTPLHLDSHPKNQTSSHEKKNRERIEEDLSGLDHKHNFANSRNQLDIRQFLLVKTSADISREEQDRRKRYKR